MLRDPGLATWLVASRRTLEDELAVRLGDAMPGAGAPESEALRRFRTFAALALRDGSAPPPALDGLRVHERAFGRLLDAWTGTALDLAGADRREGLRLALGPLSERFRAALRTTEAARRARGAPRASRRAVIAAIDRIADAFLAVDAGAGTIADANPAAGALLGRHRDQLLGTDALGFVPADLRDQWRARLEAVEEGCEPFRFHSALLDGDGRRVEVEVSVTRSATRERTLALFLARSV